MQWCLTVRSILVVGIGAVLQEQFDDLQLLVCFFSSQLENCERQQEGRESATIGLV